MLIFSKVSAWQAGYYTYCHFPSQAFRLLLLAVSQVLFHLLKIYQYPLYTFLHHSFPYEFVSFICCLSSQLRTILICLFSLLYLTECTYINFY